MEDNEKVQEKIKTLEEAVDEAHNEYNEFVEE